jgi:hypothetical protein
VDRYYNSTDLVKFFISNYYGWNGGVCEPVSAGAEVAFGTSTLTRSTEKPTHIERKLFQ